MLVSWLHTAWVLCGVGCLDRDPGYRGMPAPWDEGSNGGSLGRLDGSENAQGEGYEAPITWLIRVWGV